MKKFFEILSFAGNYKNNVIQNIFFNLLTSLFSLFSFAAIAPFLAILFQTAATNKIQKPDGFSFSSDSIINHVNYYLNQFITENGNEKSLMVFCGLIVVMFLFKNLS